MIGTSYYIVSKAGMLQTNGLPALTPVAICPDINMAQKAVKDNSLTSYVIQLIYTIDIKGVVTLENQEIDKITR